MEQQRQALVYVVTEDWYFASHRLPLAVAALNDGYEVHLVARLSDAAPTIRAHGITTHDYNIGRGSIDLGKHRSTLEGVSELFNQIRPKIVHNVAMKPVVYGSLAASRLQDPPGVVNALGGLGYLFTADSVKARVLKVGAQMALRKALNANDGALILQNDDDRNLLVDRKIASPSAIRIIRGSGVDTDFFTPEDRPERVPVVAFAARFLREKGLHEFIEAVAALRSKGTEARFALIGGPDAENPNSISLSTLDPYIKKYAIEIWGWRTDMKDTLAEVDVMVLPSYREGLPKSLIEAASSGLPIVTTDAPGCRDVVDHDVNGYLVPVRSVQPLADAIGKLVDNPGLRREFGGASRRKAERDYSISDVISNTLAIYRELGD